MYSKIKQDKKDSILSFIYAIEFSRIRKIEKYYVRRFAKSVVVAEKDKIWIGDDGISVKTNGVDIDDNVMHLDKNKKNIVFAGNLRTLQNQDSIKYFYYDVWLDFLTKNQDAIFYIVGVNPPKWIADLHGKNNVIVTGPVDDINSYLDIASVVVAPIRYAGGIQNKVLMSMARNRPVITSTLVAKAIPQARNEHNICIADSKETFIYYLDLLLNNYDLAKTIAHNGYELMCDEYAWDKVLDGYEVIDRNQ
jgi:glycosyltransferase involved in cell wall biosynthesis